AILGFKGRTLDPRALPLAFARLTAAEIEDCLCIYKGRLSGEKIQAGIRDTSKACVSHELRPRPGVECPRLSFSGGKWPTIGLLEQALQAPDVGGEERLGACYAIVVFITIRPNGEATLPFFKP